MEMRFDQNNSNVWKKDREYVDRGSCNVVAAIKCLDFLVRYLYNIFKEK
jgi:hypothetical protein